MKLHSKITLTILTSTLLINTGCVSGLTSNTNVSPTLENNTTQEPSLLTKVIDGFIGATILRIENTISNAETKSEVEGETFNQKLENEQEKLLDKGFGKASKYKLSGER